VARVPPGAARGHGARQGRLVMDADALAMPSPRARPRPRFPREAAPPPVSNTRLAMLVVIGAESMLFAGLIGAFLVFRLAAREWPPATLPRLPLAMTAVNTVVLFASLVPLTNALRAIRRDDRTRLVRAIALTAVLGAVFLGV